jgi:hypothetical protein
MEKILDPIKREKLLAELNFCKLIKRTLRHGNEIYSFKSSDAPLLMIEVARLREEAFRAVGCGTGNQIDMDCHDTDFEAYRQLIVWSPRTREIIGGYRYAVGRNYVQNFQHLSMSNYFRFSKKFIKEYLPYSIELGRAWVNPKYQPSVTEGRSIFALDNLWEGIGAIVAENENVRYLYGKITISETYHPVARIMLSWYLDHYFRDKGKLMVPHAPVIPPGVIEIAGKKVKGINMDADFKTIANYIRSLDIVIPPMFTAYLRLTRRMLSFVTTVNHELGNSFETGILIALKDIYPEKHVRYIQAKGNKLMLHNNHASFEFSEKSIAN